VTGVLVAPILGPYGRNQFSIAVNAGYGDVLPAERWRLLGPITAMTGMLLFGWSTAVIFEVLRRTLVRIHDLKD
jgi:hypothetical protein